MTRIFGPAHIDTAEAVVQEAFVRALEVWPYQRVPANPVGWLMTVARNRALDLMRRDARLSDRAPQLRAWYEQQAARDFEMRDPDRASLDDQLELMFLCCHPALSRRAQVCLTLKLAGGFAVAEVAGALLAEADFDRWNERQIARGQLLASANVKDDSGTTLRLADGQVVVDGPYSETKEAVAGWFVVRTEDEAEAIDIAKGCQFLPAREAPSYWINLAVVGAADLGLVLFLVLPGHMPVTAAAPGPVLFLGAAVLSTLARRHSAPQGRELAAAAGGTA